MKLRYTVLLVLVCALSACSNKITSKAPSRAYLYSPNTPIPVDNAIIISLVFDDRPESERKIYKTDNFFDKISAPLNKAIYGINSAIRSTTRKAVSGDGRIYYAAQVILLNQDNQKYYLGDYYPRFGSEWSERGLYIGNKGEFEINYGMPAYSIISVPSGEYSLVGNVYYKDPELPESYKNEILQTTKNHFYEANFYKNITVKPGEVVYIGDIGVSNTGIEIIDKFAQAQQFLDLSYPQLSASVVFRRAK